MSEPFEYEQVECKKGWSKLYEPLIDLCNLYNIKVLQVKEKFGGLCFYANPDDRVDLIIRAAEAKSHHVCEDCGEAGFEGWDVTSRRPIYKATTGGNGWIRTLCKPCRDIWEARRS